MAFNAIDNTRVNAAKHPDDWYADEVVAGKEQPYASLAVAYSKIPSAVRMKGRPFLVTENGLTVEYWWKDDLTTAVTKQPNILPALDSDYFSGAAGTGKAIVEGNYVTNILDFKNGAKKEYKKITGTTANDIDDNIIRQSISDGVLMDSDYKVISTRTGATNTWLKLASFTPTINNGDFSVTLALNTSNARVQSAIICVTGRQSTTGNAPFYLNIDLMAYSGLGNAPRFFDENSFRLTNNGFGTPFDLYVKKVNPNGRLALKELNLISDGKLIVDYYNLQTFSATEPTGTYTGASDKFRSSFDGLTLISYSEFTGTEMRYRRNSLKPGGGAITDADVDGLFYVKKYGFFYSYIVNGEINIRDFGAGTGSSVNDTTIFTKALTFNKKVFVPPGFNYFVRNLNVPTQCELYGAGRGSSMRLYTDGTFTAAQDSTAYVLIKNGSFNSIHDLYVNNAFNVGNGVYVLNDTNGIKGLFNNVEIAGFNSYVATVEGGTYGNLQNKSVADLTNGIGGNGLVFASAVVIGGSHFEFNSTGVVIKDCEGWGAMFGRITDATIINLTIGNCVRGYFNMNDVRNSRFGSIKVYRSGMLNIKEAFDPSIYKIIPFGDDTYCAGNLAGENIIVENFEVQECGANALQIGGTSLTNNAPINFQNSSITNLLIDGNGGINSSTVVDTSLMRTGIVFKCFYNIHIQGVVNDFRFKVKGARQKQAFRFLTKQEITLGMIDTLRGGVVRILANTGGANFTPIQGQKSPTSNAVGTIFTSSYLFSQNATDTGVTFGTSGKLETPNQFLTLDLQVFNQYDQAIGNLGYDLTNNDLSNVININGSTLNKGLVASSSLNVDVNLNNYVFNGTTATWTWATVSNNTWKRIYIKNRGTGSLTINSNTGANDFYLSSAVNTLTVAPGTAIILVNDGTYWNVE